MNEDEFLAALSATMRTVYQFDIPEDGLAIWSRAIASSGLTWDEAARALAAHVLDGEQGRFRPTPAHVIGKIRGGAKSERDALESAAMVAWGECLAACRRVGTYRAVAFDDARTMAALAAVGGWPAFGLMTDDGKPSMLAAFRRAYCGAVDGIAPPVLPGIFGDDEPAMIRTRSATIAPALAPPRSAMLPAETIATEGSHP